MAVTTTDFALNSVQFSDTAVFGRVSNVFQAYLERSTSDETIVENVEQTVSMFASVAAFFERRRVAAELNTLSDRALADMGLSREGIEAALHRV